MRFENKLTGEYVISEQMQDEDIAYRIYSSTGQYLGGGTESVETFNSLFRDFRRTE